MGRNCIFCFSGTGNSFRASRDLAEHISHCDIYAMNIEPTKIQISDYASVGFVFPVYFLGLPNAVRQFIEKLQIESGGNTYFYAIATCGRFSGNSIRQINRLLQDKGVSLQYGAKLVMGDNYVVMYDVTKDIQRAEARYKAQLPRIISEISSKKTVRIRKENRLISLRYNSQINKVFSMDKGFNIDSNCNYCNICTKVCPVHNIDIVNGKHTFGHKCQQCMACIQYCPKRAINYKDKTQSRRRYSNPEISWKELHHFYNA